MNELLFHMLYPIWNTHYDTVHNFKRRTQIAYSTTEMESLSSWLMELFVTGNLEQTKTSPIWQTILKSIPTTGEEEMKAEYIAI